MAEPTTNTFPFTFSMDAKTARFLDALRDDEQINLSAWVRDAIRRKAGLTPDKYPELINAE